MTTYIIRRLLLAIPVLLGASFLVFASVRFVPGDPAIAIAGELATPELVAQVRAEMGLDRPLLAQYGIYLERVLQGDLGRSVRSGQPVFEEISVRLPKTIQLAVLSLLVASAIGIPLGVLSAMRASTWVDGCSMVLALVGCRCRSSG
jgi:peptide/nickel transport system permease protein